MKTSHLVAGSAALFMLVLIVVLWRQSALTGELDLLRAQMTAAAAQPAPAAVQESPWNIQPAPRVIASAPGEDADRVAELERVVNAQADLIEELFSRLGGMELNSQKAAAPAWSPMQIVGAPDSAAGDQRTAWAPATQDGGEEWILATFAKPVDPATIIVRENSAPGAIVRISAVTEAGSELPLWEGNAPQAGAVSDTPFPVSPGYPVQRVKIYLDTKKVPGWNEIDSVQLVGRDGTRQWAQSASASSYYGNQTNTLRFQATEVDQLSRDTLNGSRISTPAYGVEMSGLFLSPEPAVPHGLTWESTVRSQ